MVIETIIKPSLVERKPAWAFALGVLLSSIGILIGLLAFPKNAGLAGILFIVIGGVPFLHKILDIEEVKEEKVHALKKLILRNKTIIEIYFNKLRNQEYAKKIVMQGIVDLEVFSTFQS